MGCVLLVFFTFWNVFISTNKFSRLAFAIWILFPITLQGRREWVAVVVRSSLRLTNNSMVLLSLEAWVWSLKLDPCGFSSGMSGLAGMWNDLYCSDTINQLVEETSKTKSILEAGTFYWPVGSHGNSFRQGGALNNSQAQVISTLIIHIHCTSWKYLAYVNVPCTYVVQYVGDLLRVLGWSKKSFSSCLLLDPRFWASTVPLFFGLKLQR